MDAINSAEQPSPPLSGATAEPHPKDEEPDIESPPASLDEVEPAPANNAESLTSATGSDTDHDDSSDQASATKQEGEHPQRSVSFSHLELIKPEKRTSAASSARRLSVSFAQFMNPETRASSASSRRITQENLIGGKYTERELIFVTTAGVFLSFNSGYVNGSCLSGLLTPSTVRQSVAGFTGAYTVSALELANGQTDIFGRQVCMILSFMLGACISGYMTPNATPYRLEPTYGPTFLIGGVFLIIASILAVFDQDHYLFYFAAAANGIQNGISSIYSANLIRSTHLTGTSTDIGIFIGQVLKGNRKNLWKLVVLIALAVAFWLGSLISFYATTFFTHFSLLFNAGMFMLIGASFVCFLVIELDVSVQAAIMGTWMWGKVFDELFRTSKQSFSDYFDNLEGTQDDGELDEEELLDALIEAGIKVSKRQVEILLRAADTDGNGKIDKDEWMKIATSASSSKVKSQRSEP